MRAALLSISAVWLSLLLAPGATASERVALVLGNSNYASASALPNPVNDADAMRTVLEKCGFKVILQRDLTRKDMTEAIRSFKEKLQKGGVGLLFYAGHGLQAAGRNYLVPIDADIRSEGEIEHEAVDLGRFFAAKEEADCRLNIVILDCCRNNPFERALGRSGTRGLANISAPRRSLIAYATAPGQVAQDGTEINSPYTSALMRFIPQSGVELERVFRNVARYVQDSTRGDQRPWKSDDRLEDFFFLGGVGSAPGTPEPVVAHQSPSALEVQPVADDKNVIAFARRFFEACQNNLPTALIPFLSLPMDNYFGTRNAKREHVVANRREYIERWPQRSFDLRGEPRISRRLEDGAVVVILDYA